MPIDPLRLKDVFSRALSETDPDARSAVLDAECAGDAALRSRVAALLRVSAAPDSLLDAPGPPLPIDSAATVEGRYTPNDEAVGSKIGEVIDERFKLLEKIGEGGMGEVWVADQLEPIQRRVAVKLIKPGMDSRSVLGRFEAERQALAVMDHPNIAKVLDAGTTSDGRPFFVMELVKGVPVTEFADARKLTPKQRLELFVPVCQAIQHAHMKGIIHRDIKPSNVLVALHDETPVPKVIDFGVAKAIGQQLTEKTVYTGFGALIGTPAYMAPEQATFNQLDVDTRADVYALGVLLYELLAGSPPIEKDRLKKAALDEVLRIVREEEPPRPSQRLSTADTRASIAATRGSEPAKLSALMRGELDWIVMKALEKDRTRRYDTANGLAKDVQRHLAGEAVEACPPTLGYRLRKAYRKNKAAILTSTTFAAVLLVAAGVSLAFGLLAKQSERRAVVQEGRAVTNEVRALEANEALAAERDNLRNLVYARSMQLAAADVHEDNLISTTSLLEAAPPKLRGWEWHYLNRLAHGGYQHSLEGHTENVVRGAFSSNGKWVATSSIDGTVKVWATETGRLIETLQWGLEPAWSISFSPDGKTLLASSHGRDGPPRMWDTETWVQKRTPQLRGIHAEFSRDGKWIVTAGSNSKNGEVLVWDTSTGEVQHQLEFPNAPSGGTYKAGFSPDGKWIVAHAIGSEVAYVWDTTTWELRHTLRGHTTGLKGNAQFSPDSSRIVTTSWGKDAKIWDTASGECERTIEGRSGTVLGTEFSPDGEWIAISFEEGVRVVNLKHNDVRTIPNTENTHGVISFAPDVKQLLIGIGATANLYDFRTGTVIRKLRGHTGTISFALFSPDGSQILTVGHDSTAKLWDAKAQLSPLAYLEPEPDRHISRLIHNSDGSRVAVKYADTDWTASSLEIRVFDTLRKASLCTIPGADRTLDLFDLSSDGKRLLIKNLARLPQPSPPGVEVWDVDQDRKLVTLKLPNVGVRCAVFSPDDKRIAAVGSERLWILNALTGEVMRASDLAINPKSCVFTPDGKQVLVSTMGGVVQTWDVDTGKQATPNIEQEGRRTRSALSRDGTRFFLRDGHDVGRVYDTRTGAVTAVIPNVGNGSLAVFNPKGDRMLTGGLVAPIKLWDTTTGHELLTLRIPKGWGSHFVFTPDGHGVLVTTRSGGVFEFDGRPLSR